jgi:hypothetical protein
VLVPYAQAPSNFRGTHAFARQGSYLIRCSHFAPQVLVDGRRLSRCSAAPSQSYLLSCIAMSALPLGFTVHNAAYFNSRPKEFVALNSCQMSRSPLPKTFVT